MDGPEDTRIKIGLDEWWSFIQVATQFEKQPDRKSLDDLKEQSAVIWSKIQEQINARGRSLLVGAFQYMLNRLRILVQEKFSDSFPWLQNYLDEISRLPKERAQPPS